jgi:hypothetical protein
LYLTVDLHCFPVNALKEQSIIPSLLKFNKIILLKDEILMKI